jgi:hypothetical protein
MSRTTSAAFNRSTRRRKLSSGPVCATAGSGRCFVQEREARGVAIAKQGLVVGWSHALTGAGAVTAPRRIATTTTGLGRRVRPLGRTRTDNKPGPSKSECGTSCTNYGTPRRWTLRRARPALGPRPALRVPARAASRRDASTHGRPATPHSKEQPPRRPEHRGLFALWALAMSRLERPTPQRLRRLQRRVAPVAHSRQFGHVSRRASTRERLIVAPDA